MLPRPLTQALAIGLFKRHGRWKSDQAKDGYIKDNLDSLLSKSKSLTSLVCHFSFFIFERGHQ